MRQVIRADLDRLAEPPPDVPERLPAPPAKRARAKTSHRENPGSGKPFRRRRRSRPGRGRAEGQGRAIPCLPPAPGLRFSTPVCARDPPAAGALRARLALQSAAASAKILRLNADEAALRDLRFAVGSRLGPRRSCSRCGATSPAGRPASTRAGSSTWRRRGSTSRCRKRPISTGSCELSAGA